MSDDVDVLKTVCRDLRDSADGYLEAAGMIGETPLGTLFKSRYDTREQMIRTLETRLASVLPAAEPAEIETEGSLRGELHQQFMHMKAMFQSDEAAALSTIESIEQHLAKHLRDALHSNLTLETYAVITDLVTTIDDSEADFAALKSIAS